MTKNNPKILTHFLARKVFVQTLANSMTRSVSYTHLDVYKRQKSFNSSSGCADAIRSKRQ